MKPSNGLAQVAQQLRELAGMRPKVLVAFSGGVDSMVLAHALVRARDSLAGLRLAHVDHGLQPASQDWARQCAEVAREWRVPYAVLRARIKRRRGESPEAAAREARYTLLAQAMMPGEVLVTAQHRDDQVETVLLQLLRGAGVAGLAAMPAIASFGPGRIARPLLDVTRAEIVAAARAAKLRWIEDPTNRDPRFARNYLRHHVLPLIHGQWPGADRAVARTAAHMAEARELLAERADSDLAVVADGGGLAVVALRALTPARRRNALRRYIAQAGVELPDASRLNEMTIALLSARADAQPEVRWRGAVLRRRFDRLELHVDSQAEIAGGHEIHAKSWRWADERVCVLNDAGDTLVLLDDAAGPIDLDRLPAALALAPRRGGERLRPGARARTQSLKTLLQSAKIAVEERARMPLLFTGETPKRLVAVGDRWIDASVGANVKSRRRARLRWVRTRE